MESEAEEQDELNRALGAESIGFQNDASLRLTD